jgi:carbamoyltransferase
MNILGLAGGFNSPESNAIQFPWFFHDSAAVLVQDGALTCAVEEERLNRIKHTTCFPILAIKSCLTQSNLSIRQIDRFAYYFGESFVDNALRMYHHQQLKIQTYQSVRERISSLVEIAFGERIYERIQFVDHHLAHAASAWYPSGFDSSLVMVVDGMGENVSLTIYDANQQGLTKLESFSASDSLGLFYLLVTEHLGYSIFDEYKVMGLAPYGDPLRFKQVFSQLCSYEAAGRYSLSRKKVSAALEAICPKRLKSAPFEQIHKDIAAAAQAELEQVLIHVLRHWQGITGHHRLALAGGVAHNCTNNGKILASGLFDEVFVQPASHDAGCALGAALQVSSELSFPRFDRTILGRSDSGQAMYLGADIGSSEHIRSKLKGWASLLKYNEPRSIYEETAQRLSQGQVGGWVQGRSEFGPRALGNRSIVADPRPASNKDLVNLMVKKREAYRPFAPSIQVEALKDFYQMSESRADLGFMTYALQTQLSCQQLLGAVTHVDGSARVQTVSLQSNPKYWHLIEAFKSLTGVPVLLNTSFNNNVEPIVDSIEDAITCFLTTGLHFLVIGQFLIERCNAADVVDKLCDMAVSQYPHIKLTRCEGDESSAMCEWKLQHVFKPILKPVSTDVAELLMGAREAPIAGNVAFSRLNATHSRRVLEEVFELWDERLIRLQIPTFS